MAWLLGFLLLAAAIAWLLHERRVRRELDRLHDELADLSHARKPAGVVLHGRLARLDARAQQVAREQEHLRRQRQLAEANLQIILSSMREGVLVVDGQRAIRLVNPSLRDLFALPEHVFGEPVLGSLREPAVDDLIRAAMESGQSQEHDIEIANRSQGGALKLHVVVSPMHDAAGEPGALAMFRDITRLSQLEQVRREFVANVSHELRTPLSIFQGYVENLVDRPDAPLEERAEIYSVLQKHSSRLNALVEDLLILARLEGPKGELHRERVQLGPFLAETARDWSLRATQSDLRLELDIAADIPSVSADRFRLEQVFNNLLENAFKYTPAGNRVTLGAAPRDGFVECWVADTGQGILAGDLSHIFERFYRPDRARSRDRGGTGLGLSIVKHIVQAHGGSVEAESAFGKGTTIRMLLPLEPSVGEHPGGAPEMEGSPPRSMYS